MIKTFVCMEPFGSPKPEEVWVKLPCAVIGHTKAALYMHTAIVFLIQIIYKL